MRQRIKEMKAIKAEHNLSIADILDLVADNGGYISESTAKKIFAVGSENKGFLAHSIITLYEALVSKFGDIPDVSDAKKLKRMVKERNKQIDNLMIRIEEREQHYAEQLAMFDERRVNFEKTIAILQKQNDTLAEQVAFRDAMLAKVFDAYLMTNTQDDKPAK